MTSRKRLFSRLLFTGLMAGSLPPFALAHSELTLLSACNTVSGENVSGEGLMGLWPVAGEDTAEFVSSLLAQIKAGPSHAQAITAAKREFSNHANPRERNPYFWTPFVLYGV